jgi:large subunit ribosomal protein L10
MPTEKKVQIVEELQGVFQRCTVGVMTDYRGLTTSELNDLRRKLRAAGIEYHVVKNSLAQIAAKNAGLDDVAASFEGPMALAFGYGEAPEAAKVLADYIRTSKSILSIKGGFLPDRALSAAEVETLAKLPSREVLLAQVMAGMQSPIYGFVNVLSGTIRGVMNVLQARIKQLEEA